MTTEFAKQVHEYVLADRQWPRHLRIAHAKMQMEKTLSVTSKNFWRAILKRNEDDK